MASNQTLAHNLNSPPSMIEISPNQNITLGADQPERKNPFDTNLAPSLSENYAIHFELKNISREVTRMAQKGKHITQNMSMTTSLPLYDTEYKTNELEKDLQSMLNLKKTSSHLGKYNYYGRQYRFCTQNPSQTSPKKPMQSNHIHQEPNCFSPTSKLHPQRQILNVPDSQSYFIYFDQPHNKPQTHLKLNKTDSHAQKYINNAHDVIDVPVNKKSNLYGSLNFNKLQKQPNLSQEYDEQARTPPLQIFSKQEPESKWVLEKKVKKLQKQLNMLKQKQQQREKLRNFTSNQPKKDSKVYVEKQVDQLINSLWP